MTEAGKFTESKQPWPPRLFHTQSFLTAIGTVGERYGPYEVEYLSMAEHTHLLAEAVREATSALASQLAEAVTILERLQKSDEWCGKPFNEDIGEFLNKLRAQLAEATKALEFYAGETKHGCWRGNEFFAFDDFGGLDDDNVGPAEALRFLAKLKAGR